MAVLRSAKAYLERAGIHPTYQRPTRRMHFPSNPAHKYPMSPPYPKPELFVDSSPDRGSAELWPPKS